MKVKNVFQGMEVGQTLKVITTDPGSRKDFSLFCQNIGSELLSSSQEGDKFIYLLKKTA